MPTVTIDNIQVEVEQGATILDAAKKAGVWIPTLCFHPAVEPQASCRICMVELDRGEWKQLVTACNYPVRGDITISVSSENAVKARRGVMEFLLARAPDNEQLKAIAGRMGVDSTPWPTVTASLRDCILCGLCTAVCDEVLGLASIGFAGRGVDRAIAAPFRQAPDNCIACGACVAVCPVGAIQIRHHEDTDEIEISPFKARVKLRKCEKCGANIASELTVAETLKNISGNLKKIQNLAKLCPRCRRIHTAESLTSVTGQSEQVEGHQ
ncbi:MAG: 4Fe-4S dicluster domain-containing protein [bacterium]|nr:4Fe-4S dicluster domain-containing protein [bacterium]